MRFGCVLVFRVWFGYVNKGKSFVILCGVRWGEVEEGLENERRSVVVGMGDNGKVVSLVGKIEREELLGFSAVDDVSMMEITNISGAGNKGPRGALLRSLGFMSPRKVPAATAAAMADDPVPLYKSARGLQANMASLMNGVDVEINDVGHSREVVPVLRSKSCSKSRSHRELREELLGISRPSVGNRELRSNSVVRRSPRTKLNEAGSVPGQGVRVIRQPAKSPMRDVLHSADESLSHIEEVSGKMAHSPLRSRVEAMESMSKSLRPSERTYHRKLRSPHASMEGTAELYNGEEISVVVQRKGRPRQHKRKLSESNPILPPLQPIEPGSRSARGDS